MTGSHMADDSSNLALEQLRALRSDVDEMPDDVREVKRRLTSLEVFVASLHGDFAGQSARIDWVELRLERIEHRLNSRDT
jgi:hypothetical protein